MAFGKTVRWEHIATLKKAMPVPVIGNGEVRSVADAKRMFEETGCDAVMIGRAPRRTHGYFHGVTVSRSLWKKCFIWRAINYDKCWK